MNHTPLQETHEAVAPWYRQGWFWFIVGIPMASVCLGTTMLIVAFTHQDSLVKDEYYRDGKAINQVIARNQRAEALEIGATVTIDELTGEVALQVGGKDDLLPSVLRLSFLSPTLASQDQVIDIRQIAPGRYIGQLTQQIKGRRYVHLETIETQDSYKPSEKGWLIESQQHIEAGNRFQIGYFGS
ncbi:FixH family protein [Aestuariirhabdus sp. LZHN29]|uniref:FixH family protein n=1 Tax=Aestuariirhabdus sp. LZHN29 TaxID=3417462 RepID=UPI003CF4450C